MTCCFRHLKPCHEKPVKTISLLEDAAQKATRVHDVAFKHGSGVKSKKYILGNYIIKMLTFYIIKMLTFLLYLHISTTIAGLMYIVRLKCMRI